MRYDSVIINFINWDILLVWNSVGFIADGIHTLDNRRPVLPFDYVGQGFTDDAYVEGAYDEDGYDFASWRLGCSSLCCKYFKGNVL